jgi:hypothetical protein
MTGQFHQVVQIPQPSSYPLLSARKVTD